MAQQHASGSRGVPAKGERGQLTIEGVLLFFLVLLLLSALTPIFVEQADSAVTALNGTPYEEEGSALWNLMYPFIIIMAFVALVKISGQTRTEQV